MLAVTDQAASVICQLMTTSPSDSAGMRIATAPTGNAMHLSVVSEPEEGDAVVDASGGARVFLDRHAVQVLDDMALDVQTDAAGQVEFALTPKSG
jgi:Fe-S cluster assembly iron-binding protein IscA